MLPRGRLVLHKVHSVHIISTRCEKQEMFNGHVTKIPRRTLYTSWPDTPLYTHSWTWTSPDRMTHKQIDYILLPEHIHLRDCQTHPAADTTVIITYCLSTSKAISDLQLATYDRFHESNGMKLSDQGNGDRICFPKAEFAFRKAFPIRCLLLNQWNCF